MKKVMVNTKGRWDRNDRWTEAIIEDDGAMKWASNGRYVPSDCAERIIANGFAEFSKEATEEKRDAQIGEELTAYRRNYRGPSQEEMNEMRAAFGNGTTVIDVITGKEVRL